MNDKEAIVRRAYAIAEEKDIQGWIDCFTPDGVFVDQSIQVTYKGPEEVAKPVGYYGAAFSDMHRELPEGKIHIFNCYPEGSVVLSQLGVLSDLGAVLEPLAA
jgi:hypothetical protein